MARRGYYRPYKKAFPIMEFLLGAVVGAVVVMIHGRATNGGFYSVGGRGMAVSGKVTHQPYAIPIAATQLLPSDQTSVTGKYPPPTGPY